MLAGSAHGQGPCAALPSSHLVLAAATAGRQLWLPRLAKQVVVEAAADGQGGLQ